MGGQLARVLLETARPEEEGSERFKTLNPKTEEERVSRANSARYVCLALHLNDKPKS